MCWSWFHTVYWWLWREIDLLIEESYEGVLRRKSKRICEFWQNYQQKTLSVRFGEVVFSFLVVKMKVVLIQLNLFFLKITQLTFTCSKSIIETLKKVWNMLKVNSKNRTKWLTLLAVSSVVKERVMQMENQVRLLLFIAWKRQTFQYVTLSKF